MLDVCVLRSTMTRNEKNKLIKLHILDEIEKEMLIMEQTLKRNQKIDDVFVQRKSEGFFSVSIEKHLFKDETKLNCTSLD